jgi:phosphoribosylamine--glycine ligase
VLEYNVRFGDPETAVLVPTYGGDWFDLLDSAARGALPRTPVAMPTRAALAVVMAAAGYPAQVRTGDRIEGLDASLPEGAFVFHAGTTRAKGANGGDLIVTSGGRVLAVGASGNTLEQAARLAYEAVARIRWEGEHHRRDIGRRALSRT